MKWVNNWAQSVCKYLLKNVPTLFYNTYYILYGKLYSLKVSTHFTIFSFLLGPYLVTKSFDLKCERKYLKFICWNHINIFQRKARSSTVHLLHTYIVIFWTTKMLSCIHGQQKKVGFFKDISTIFLKWKHSYNSELVSPSFTLL